MSLGFVRCLIRAGFPIVLVFPVAATGQVPLPGTPPTQIQQQINAQGLRAALQARIKNSGLTQDQIRDRLRQMGYDPTSLDPYLDDRVANPPDPTAALVTAATAIGVLEVPLVNPPATPPPAAPPRNPIPTDADKVRVFGLDVFSRNTSEFQPLTSGPVPPNYVIGPGDELVLIITGDVEFSYTLPVTREGFVLIPQVGTVSVNGLTLDGVRNAMYAHLGRVYSGVRRDATATTHFTVSLGRLRTNQVFATGEIRAPGSLVVSSLASLLNALYLAGGPTENGSFRHVQVKRAGRTVHDVDVYDYLLSGDNLGSIRLEPGDVIFVPIAGKQVAIHGEVRRPAIFELVEGETLADLIELAGGTTAPAFTRRARITRILAPEQRTAPGVDRTTIDVGLDDIIRNPATAPALQDGDVITVFAVRSEVRNRVSLGGAVWRPGSFEFRPGMRAWDLIAEAQGLTPEAYLERAIITRVDSADASLSVIPFSLARNPDGSPRENPGLSEFDAVEVFSMATSTEELPISIEGEVYTPLQGLYKEGMTLRDLIVAAGGLRPTAHYEIEITRLARGEARDSGVVAKTTKIRVDSTYFISEQASRFFFGDPETLARVIGEGEAASYQLMPYDRVYVRRLPEFEFHRTIKIGGEVRHPGTFTLLRKDDRIRDFVLDRAGGLTPSAFAEGFRFYRNGVRVNLRLDEILNDPATDENLILLPGDSMFVPEYNPIVIVAGAVNSPGAVHWEGGRDLDYYIESAGGFARNADKGRIHVRYANGEGRIKRRVLFFTNSPEPGPGSVVTVVEGSDEKTDIRGIIADVTQIVATVGAILIVALR